MGIASGNFGVLSAPGWEIYVGGEKNLIRPDPSACKIDDNGEYMSTQSITMVMKMKGAVQAELSNIDATVSDFGNKQVGILAYQYGVSNKGTVSLYGTAGICKVMVPPVVIVLPRGAQKTLALIQEHPYENLVNSSFSINENMRSGDGKIVPYVATTFKHGRVVDVFKQGDGVMIAVFAYQKIKIKRRVLGPNNTIVGNWVEEYDFKKGKKTTATYTASS